MKDADDDIIISDFKSEEILKDSSKNKGVFRLVDTITHPSKNTHDVFEFGIVSVQMRGKIHLKTAHVYFNGMDEKETKKMKSEYSTESLLIFEILQKCTRENITIHSLQKPKSAKKKEKHVLKNTDLNRHLTICESFLDDWSNSKYTISDVMNSAEELLILTRNVSLWSESSALEYAKSLVNQCIEFAEKK